MARGTMQHTPTRFSPSPQRRLEKCSEKTALNPGYESVATITSYHPGRFYDKGIISSQDRSIGRTRAQPRYCKLQYECFDTNILSELSRKEWKFLITIDSTRGRMKDIPHLKCILVTSRCKNEGKYISREIWNNRVIESPLLCTVCIHTWKVEDG